MLGPQKHTVIVLSSNNALQVYIPPDRAVAPTSPRGGLAGLQGYLTCNPPETPP